MKNHVPQDAPRLQVIGLVYLEVFMPSEAVAPAPGEENFLDDLRLGVGGALNAASVSHALGTPTILSFPSPIGPFATVAEKAARALGIECRPWSTATEPPISLVFSHPNDRSFLSRADFAAFGECPPLPDSSWVLVAGLREARQLELQLRASRERGARICVNASWAPEELEDLSSRSDLPWDLLVLNEKEAMQAAPKGIDPLEALAKSVPEVVVTLAQRGTRALMEKARFEVPAAPTTQIVDTIGTGDAFCAALLHARMCGVPVDKSLAYAAQVAAKVIAIRGGVVFDPVLFKDLELPC